MADVKQHAGGGPETQQREWSVGEYQQAQYQRIANPSMTTPMESFPEWVAREKAAAFRQAQVLEQAQRDSIGRQMGATLHGLTQGIGDFSTKELEMMRDVGGGTAQMPRAPGKLFTRSDILAIIRAQHALALRETSTAEWKAAKNSAFRDLVTIFENLE